MLPATRYTIRGMRRYGVPVVRPTGCWRAAASPRSAIALAAAAGTMPVRRAAFSARSMRATVSACWRLPRAPRVLVSPVAGCGGGHDDDEPHHRARQDWEELPEVGAAAEHDSNCHKQARPHNGGPNGVGREPVRCQLRAAVDRLA